jgi:predicted SnoaL-like aldol condensation-catalyzing enzyme
MAYHAKPSTADMRRDRLGTSIARQVAGDSPRHARDHVHQKSGLSVVRWLLRKMPSPAPGKERANVDIFRAQDSKVAEHWDYQETFPPRRRAVANVEQAAE